jgi:hypothetical protein
LEGVFGVETVVRKLRASLAPVRLLGLNETACGLPLRGFLFSCFLFYLKMTANNPKQSTFSLPAFLQTRFSERKMGELCSPPTNVQKEIPAAQNRLVTVATQTDVNPNIILDESYYTYLKSVLQNYINDYAELSETIKTKDAKINDLENKLEMYRSLTPFVKRLADGYYGDMLDYE